MRHPGGNETKQVNLKFRKSGLEFLDMGVDHRDGMWGGYEQF